MHPDLHLLLHRQHASRLQHDAARHALGPPSRRSRQRLRPLLAWREPAGLALVRLGLRLAGDQADAAEGLGSPHAVQ